MAGLCFCLALISPVAMALGWFLVSYPPFWTVGNAPALVLMAISPLAFIASSIIGIKQVLDGNRKGTGWLAAALVFDYCWFHAALTAIIIEQVGRR
jgi:hypothetical protein